ncbi:MAG: hypothetical protein V7723_07505 [Sneathiella sp.]|uniref:alpha/beta fold hydrolase n=1 Tax=Sneathiella sp. TaxID=1964365 RepID=UPI00300221F4
MTKIIMVHGYNHDPDDPRHTADRLGGTYPIWRDMLQGNDLEPLHWYSGRTGISGRLTAIRNGFWRNTYAYAYEVLAKKAGEKLEQLAMIDASRNPQRSSVICHSLGSRVALYAMAKHPNCFDRILFLNAAETVDVATPIIEKNDKTKILNVCVESDDVLAMMGSWFEPLPGRHDCMGQAGLKSSASNFEQVFLDDPTEQEKYWLENEWALSGNNPESIGDHHFSYLFRGNWPLYRDFFAS